MYVMDDYAAPQKARTRYDRTLRAVKLVLDELIEMKTSYISNMYVMWG